MQIGQKTVVKKVYTHTHTGTPTYLHDANDESKQTNGTGKDLNNKDTHEEGAIGSISKGSSGP